MTELMPTAWVQLCTRWAGLQTQKKLPKWSVFCCLRQHPSSQAPTFLWIAGILFWVLMQVTPPRRASKNRGSADQIAYEIAAARAKTAQTKRTDLVELMGLSLIDHS